MDWLIWLQLLLFTALLMLSAFFSSAETAVFSLKITQRERLAQQNHHRIGLINRLLNEPRRLIVTILIGNELVNVSASVLSAGIVIQFYGADYKFLNLFFMIPILLLVGEITPKSLALRNNIAFATRQAPWIDRFAILIKPVRMIVLKIADFIITLIIGRDRSSGNIITKDMVRTLASDAADQGALDSQEAEMIHQIFDFSKMEVETVMTPRSDINYTKASNTLQDTLTEVRDHRHTKIPVYNRNRDDVIGVLYSRDLLGMDLYSNNQTLSSQSKLLRKPYFVPQSKPVTDLFNSFCTRKLSIAIVVDEYGGVIGLVTMEDLLETIFGNIHSPSDGTPEMMQILPNNRYSIDGSMEINDVNQCFGLNLPSQGADTISGLLLHEFGELPTVGATLKMEEVNFTVTELDEIRIKNILVNLETPANADLDQIAERLKKATQQVNI